MEYFQALMTARRVDREPFLVDVVRGLKALHVGCVDAGLLSERLRSHSFLHDKLRSSASELWGLDIDAPGIHELQRLGYENVLVGSAEELPKAIPRKYFDVVVAGEIVEHVRNVGLFLDAAGESLKPGGMLILTTPNAFRFFNLWPAMAGRELVHPEHLVWFSPFTLKRAVERANFEAIDMRVYGTPPFINPDKARDPFKRLLRHLYNGAMAIIHPTVARTWPYLLDGLILVARKGPAS